MNKQLLADLKTAMKEKDSLAKGVIQLLKAKVDSLAKEQGSEVTDSQFYDLVRSELKQLDQTYDFAVKGNRRELLLEIKYKQQVLNKYLPAQLTYDEVFAQVSKLVDVDGDFGSNMKRISATLGDVASKRDISTALKFYL